MISRAVGRPPLPREQAGTATCRREPCCFHGSHMASTGGGSEPLAPAGARRWEGAADYVGGERELHCFHGRWGCHLLSRPALGHGDCGLAPRPCPCLLWIWGASLSQGAVACCPPASVSISALCLTCVHNLLLSGHDLLQHPSPICILPHIYFKF